MCVARWWVWYVDELRAERDELTRVRDELVEQLNVARHNEQIARADLTATEQANCAYNPTSS